MNTLTLPFPVANEVVERMMDNPSCVVQLITHSCIGGILKTTITYHIGSSLLLNNVNYFEINSVGSK